MAAMATRGVSDDGSCQGKRGNIETSSNRSNNFGGDGSIAGWW